MTWTIGEDSSLGDADIPVLSSCQVGKIEVNYQRVRPRKTVSNGVTGTRLGAYVKLLTWGNPLWQYSLGLPSSTRARKRKGSGLFERRRRMPDVARERRTAPRCPMVLAADVVDLSLGARLTAQTSDISRTGCYIDTLNPIPQGSRVRLRITHHSEIFEAVAEVVYVSYGLGMGVILTEVAPGQREKLERWLEDRNQEL